jgi:hypothetical protein
VTDVRGYELLVVSLRDANAKLEQKLQRARELARRWDGEDVSDRLRELLDLLAAEHPCPRCGGEMFIVPHTGGVWGHDCDPPLP